MKKYLLIFLLLFSAMGFAQWQSLAFTSTGGGDCDLITVGGGEVFISEVYDGLPAAGGGTEQSYAIIELYNPSSVAVNLSGYSIRRSGNFDNNWTWTVNLNGTIGAAGTYLIKIERAPGDTSSTCTFIPNFILASTFGINDNDRLQLLKNGNVLDDLGAPNWVGFTMIRRPDAEAPKVLFNNADWQTTPRNCGNIGNHTIDNITPPEIDNISRYRDNPGTIPYAFCETPARVRVQMDTVGSGFTYSYNLRGTTTTVNTTNTTGIFSNLQADTYILTVTISRNSVFLCTHQVRFNVTAGVQTSPIILLN